MFSDEDIERRNNKIVIRNSLDAMEKLFSVEIENVANIWAIFSRKLCDVVYFFFVFFFRRCSKLKIRTNGKVSAFLFLSAHRSFLLLLKLSRNFATTQFHQCHRYELSFHCQTQTKINNFHNFSSCFPFCSARSLASCDSSHFSFVFFSFSSVFLWFLLWWIKKHFIFFLCRLHQNIFSVSRKGWSITLCASVDVILRRSTKKRSKRSENE